MTDHIEPTISIRKVQTQKGERLEIDATKIDASIRVDALALESVAWQDDSTALCELLRWSGMPTPDEEVHIAFEGGEELTISNEYTHVVVSPTQVDGVDGVYLESVGLEYAIELTSQALETLASQDSAYAMSEFLKTPFGPEDVERATKLVDTPADSHD